MIEFYFLPSTFHTYLPSSTIYRQILATPIKTLYTGYMISVIKANGMPEPFSEEKLRRSIIRARVPQPLQQQVLNDVKTKLYNNISTAEIYGNILDNLGKSTQPYSKASYSLKQAIMMLGPTGYPFEDFVSRILETIGYKTVVRQILRGNCVSHEVDVIAEKNGVRSMVEAKFHNNPGTRSDVHVALYTHARFLDLKEKYDLDEAWIVTNTKTTTDAVAYAECVKMKTVSWSYPEEGSLRDLVEKAQLRPITMLTSLSSAQKMKLLKNHVVLCKDIRANHGYLDLLQLTQPERKTVLSELDFICAGDDTQSSLPQSLSS
jgi:Holliday junction resolvase-like predicted endonuclease